MHKDCLEQSMPSIQSKKPSEQHKLIYWILAFASMTIMRLCITVSLPASHRLQCSTFRHAGLVDLHGRRKCIRIVWNNPCPASSRLITPSCLPLGKGILVATDFLGSGSCFALPPASMQSCPLATFPTSCGSHSPE